MSIDRPRAAAAVAPWLSSVAGEGVLLAVSVFRKGGLGARLTTHSRSGIEYLARRFLDGNCLA